MILFVIYYKRHLINGKMKEDKRDLLYHGRPSESLAIVIKKEIKEEWKLLQR